MPRYQFNYLGQTYKVQADSPEEAKAKARAHRIAQDQKAAQEDFAKSEAEQPLGQKVLENVGAGMTAAWEGAKDIGKDWFGVGPGMTDEQINESRRMREQLAEDTNARVPLLGSALQVAGEVAPTLTLGAPLGLAAKGARLISPIGKVLTKTRSMGGKYLNPNTAALGAVEGGLTGALPATKTDETRTAGVVGGTLLGGALPSAVGAAKGAWRYFRPNEEQTALLGRKQFEKLVGKPEVERVTREVQEAVGAGGVPLSNPNNPIPSNLPMTTAGFTRSHGLGRMERGARNRSNADFRLVDDPAAEEAWRQVRAATPEASRVDELTQQRNDLMTTRLNQLRRMDDPTVGADIEAAIQPYMSHYGVIENPAIRQEIGQLLNTATRPDTNIANIMEGYQRILDLERSGINHPVLRQVKDEIATILDARTGGRFSDAYANYEGASRGIEKATAQRSMRREFMGDLGNPDTSRQVIDTVTGEAAPVVEGLKLRRALEKGSTTTPTGTRVSALDDPNLQMMNNLQRDLDRANIWTAEQSPGSISYELAGLLSPSQMATGAKRGVIGWAQKGRHGRMEKQMDRALQTPQEWADMIRLASQREAPITSGWDDFKLQTMLGALRAPVFGLSEGDYNAP